MASPKGRTPDRIPCDFCTQQAAVLYCRADSAKLCLFCDHHVHSANLLSRKHFRSRLCNNCSSGPVSVQCNTDNLLLCQDCDWDAHAASSVSSSHNRTPVDGFTGCPSPLALASIWGFDLVAKKSDLRQTRAGAFYGDLLPSLDVTVPNHNALPFSRDVNVDGVNTMSKHNPNCGRHKQVIYKQLLELLKRESWLVGDGANGDGETLVSETRTNRCGTVEHGNVDQPFDDGLLAGAVVTQPAPFTSLLMMSNQQDLQHKKGDDAILDSNANTVWDSIPNGQATQVTLLSFFLCLLPIILLVSHSSTYMLLLCEPIMIECDIKT